MTRLQIQTSMDALLEWRDTALRFLDEMRADLMKDARLLDDTLPRDCDQLRHLMGRRELIVNRIRLETSRARGPGTPGWKEM